MKKTLGLILFAAAFWGCGTNGVEPVTPPDISNLTATPGTGEPGTADQRGTITLNWTKPASGDYLYAQIQYVDPVDGELKKVNVSNFAEGTYTLKGLFKKNGEYAFKVYPVSSTGTLGTPLEVKATSKKVPAAITEIITKIPLTADKLASDVTDPSEGSLANLLDGDKSTFWHSDWHSPKPFPQYWTIKLGREVDRVKLRMTSRNSSTNGAIKESVLLATNVSDDVADADVTDWTTLAAFPESTFRGGNAVTDDTPIAPAGEPSAEPLDYKFRRLKLQVNSIQNQFWFYSELEVFSVAYEIFDPDKDMAED